MKTILVTGASGFIGKNLCVQLAQRADTSVLKFTRESTSTDLEEYIKKADFIYHIAGINRPKDEKEFTTGNQLLTEEIIALLHKHNKATPVLITSSIQAALDNPYGKSKLAAEQALREWSKQSNSMLYVYRLPNVFGKWSKPAYNSVVATFCHNIARGLPVTVNDPNHQLTLVYIDDVISSFVDALDQKVTVDKEGYCLINKTFQVTIQDLKDRITSLHNNRSTLVMPNLEDELNKNLYATLTTYLEEDDFNYELATHNDQRGWLAEFIKSNQFGQIFISKTKPGIARGNHWHHTKIEKFLVVDGEAEITFRKATDSKRKIIRYTVSGDKPTVLDIPAGYVHAIKNIGETDLTTIFWADEILDKEKPDTYYEEV